MTTEDMTLLTSCVGQYVCVAIVPDGYTRNTFGPQIAVGGILEAKNIEGEKPELRVVANDDNFCYFTPEQVVLINTLATRPTITLNIPVVLE